MPKNDAPCHGLRTGERGPGLRGPLVGPLPPGLCLVVRIPPPGLRPEAVAGERERGVGLPPHAPPPPPRYELLSERRGVGLLPLPSDRGLRAESLRAAAVAAAAALLLEGDDAQGLVWLLLPLLLPAAEASSTAADAKKAPLEGLLLPPRTGDSGPGLLARGPGLLARRAGLLARGPGLPARGGGLLARGGPGLSARGPGLLERAHGAAGLPGAPPRGGLRVKPRAGAGPTAPGAVTSSSSLLEPKDPLNGLRRGDCSVVLVPPPPPLPSPFLGLRLRLRSGERRGDWRLLRVLFQGDGGGVAFGVQICLSDLTWRWQWGHFPDMKDLVPTLEYLWVWLVCEGEECVVWVGGAGGEVLRGKCTIGVVFSCGVMRASMFQGVDRSSAC